MSLLTRRKDQVGDPFIRKARKTGAYIPAAETLIGGIIHCGSAEGRKGWIRRLHQKHPQHFNSFVCFPGPNGTFDLQFGFADWAGSQAHVIW